MGDVPPNSRMFGLLPRPDPPKGLGDDRLSAGSLGFWRAADRARPCGPRGAPPSRTRPHFRHGRLVLRDLSLDEGSSRRWLEP